MDLPWLYKKVSRNRSRSSGRTLKDGQVERLGGLVQVEGQRRRAEPVSSR